MPRILPPLRDRVRPPVRLLLVGINPGIRSAETGHHFAGYSNRFWKLLYDSKLVPEPITYADDQRLPEWGIGVTIYRVVFAKRASQPVGLGLQVEELEGVRVFVLPNPSGRNANYSYQEM